MIEKRYLSLAEAELRLDAREGQPPKIRGYAAVYNSLSEDLGGFRERIRPGAFSLDLQKDPDVRALVDHQPHLILGRTRAKTLALTNTQRGLLADIDPPDNSYAQDLCRSIERGDVSGMSFGFRTIHDEWSEEAIDGQLCLIRELVEVKLFDVSAVTYPAYPDTEVGLRRLQEWQSHGALVELERRRRRLQLLQSRATP